MSDPISLENDNIGDWRSIVTLIVFVLTNLVVLFPFHIPIYAPTALVRGILAILRHLRIIRPQPTTSIDQGEEGGLSQHEPDRKTERLLLAPRLTRLSVPINFVTAPLTADLFLLAILAIGRDEVYRGTIGSHNIQPVDIMAFFLTLAYIAISIDASGLIRYLAFRVLRWGGKVGQRLFFYLYAFFFLLGSLIGNDPIILSGTAFLAYMTRVSNNIEHPRAWIHTQFAIANIASAILVSSNPTNLVLAGAFNIRFIDYTANMVVPVVATAIVLFPCLLYIIFAHERLIPIEITMHELPDEVKSRKPVNPNIPNARGHAAEAGQDNPTGEQGKLLSLEEIMNPFLDRGGAAFGAAIMAAALVAVLVLNAVSQSSGEHPVFYVTLPAAFLMLCWDLASGWMHRVETREIASRGKREIEAARAARLLRAGALLTGAEPSSVHGAAAAAAATATATATASPGGVGPHPAPVLVRDGPPSQDGAGSRGGGGSGGGGGGGSTAEEKTMELSAIGHAAGTSPATQTPRSASPPPGSQAPHLPAGASRPSPSEEKDGHRPHSDDAVEPGATRAPASPRTLVSLAEDAHRWCQETFPTVAAVSAHLPFALVPFALAMFVLVEALVTKGWVPVFARGWDHWVAETGTVGAVGGMAFLSVILCNFAGTNIGTTILLSRVVQAWQQIHADDNGISDRNFWATVYAMALGVNYGAFSTAFSASLAGLLWRDILARKHIHVRRLEFARVNLPIIAVAMSIGCLVLIGEVYLVRSGERPYSMTA